MSAPTTTRITPPSEEVIERGVKFSTGISHHPAAPVCFVPESAGAGFDGTLGPDPSRSAHSPVNLLRKPDVVLRDATWSEVLRIVRRSRWPARFELLQAGRVVGSVERKGLFRNRYVIGLAGGSTWVFRMPLFTICFWGVSERGERLWVQVGPSKQQWNFLLEPGADDLRLIGALAFIHREWWCYS